MLLDHCDNCALLKEMGNAIFGGTGRWTFAQAVAGSTPGCASHLG